LSGTDLGFIFGPMMVKDIDAVCDQTGQKQFSKREMTKTS